MTIVRVTGSPSITAGTFDVGDGVGTQIEFTTAANAGAVVGCRVLDKGRQSVPLELWLFRGTTTGTWNNVAFAPSDGQIANLTGVVRIWNWFAAAANSIGQADNLPLSFADLSGGLLYGWLVCRGTPTYAAGDLTVELELEQGATPLARRRLYYRKRRYPPLTTLNVTQRENFHSIHLKFTCSQPLNLAPSTVKITGSYLLNARWIDFHPALPDPQSPQTLYTVLFGLQEDKTYPVKIEFRRTNNATGALIERKTYHNLYKTRKTPTYDTEISDAKCVFVAPSTATPAGNDANAGTQAAPKKTLAAAIATLLLGSKKVIVLENGTYDNAQWTFDAETGTTIADFVGISGAYKVIRARNPNQAVISGARPMSGSWTNPSANVYRYALTGLTEADDANRGPGFLRRQTNDAGGVAGTVLPMYKTVADLVAGTPYGGEGFAIDWHTNEIVVRTTQDVTPTSGQYVAAGPNFWGLHFDRCNFLILDGLKVDMFQIGKRDNTARTITNVTVNAVPASYTITIQLVSGETKHTLWPGGRVNISGISGAGNLPTDLNQNQLKIDSVTATTITILDDTAGGSYTSGGTATPTDLTEQETSIGGLWIQRSTDIVVRNGTFTVAPLILQFFHASPVMERITIEDTVFESYDPWGKQTVSAPYFDENLWDYWDLEARINAQTTNPLSPSGCRRQFVLRRCTIRKAFAGPFFGFNLSQAGTVDNTDADIYENTFERIFDDCLEWDWDSTTGTGTCINHAAWHNTFNDVNGCFSVSPLPKGPIWIIANRAEDYAFYFLRKGSDTSDQTRGAAWLLDYNNTRYTTLINRDLGDTPVDQPAPGWSTNKGQTNARIINAIISHPNTGHTHNQVGDGFDFPGTGNPDVLFQTCAFYSSDSDPEWYWEDSGTAYQTWQAMDATEPDSELRMMGVIDCNNPNGGAAFDPLPNGVAGAVHSNIVGIATHIPGVTSIAADANGNALTEPLALGYFPKWQS